MKKPMKTDDAPLQEVTQETLFILPELMLKEPACGNCKYYGSKGECKIDLPPMIRFSDDWRTHLVPSTHLCSFHQPR